MKKAKNIRFSFVLPILLVGIIFLYVLMHDLKGGTLLKSSVYNSYTRQAMAWRSGQMHLEGNAPWLELAIYGGKYWVSFPPAPSVLMLPLTYIFGYKTPDNLVMLLLVLLSVTAVYFCCKKRNYSPYASALIAAGTVLGSNLFQMSMEGAVWFMAQGFCFCFCVWALYSALKGRYWLAFALCALALGCRPFSVLVALPILWLCIRNSQHKPFFAGVLHVELSLLAAILIGLTIMWYNYARFNNGFEFGHNYLPEFNRGEAQFSIAYIPRNLKGLAQGISFNSDLTLNFPLFNGFFPLIANPILLLILIEGIICTCNKEWTIAKLITLGALGLNLLLLLCHRTFGGFQFGARYTVDLIPYALLFFLPLPRRKLTTWRGCILAFGILFNAYGAIKVQL